MKISKKGQYALLSIADLAIYAKAQPQSIAIIAQRQGIDPRYLAQIFFTLKNAGLILSIRGKNGGYVLSRPADKITAGDVVRAIEGTLAPTKCSVSSEEAPKCKQYPACITHELWHTLAGKINEVLNDMTIANLVDRCKEMGCNL